MLPPSRLVLLVGSFAHARYLPHAKGLTLSDRVARFADYLPGYFPLPHPSWRSTGWMRRNPWFEQGVLPALKSAINQRL